MDHATLARRPNHGHHSARFAWGGAGQRIDPQQPGAKVKPDKIVEATVVRKRAHPCEPKALPEPNRGPGRAREKTRDE